MKDYNFFAKTFSRSRKNLRWAELDYIVNDIIDNNFSSILDIGCGNGRFLEFFPPERNIEYYGLDSSTEMIAEAKRLHAGKRFFIGDMQNLINCIPGEKKIDAIIFLASFHHLRFYEERIHVLQSAKTALSEKGKIYMTNWNLHEQERYQSSYRGDNEYFIKIGDFERFYYAFSLSELGELFQKTNFCIEKNEIFQGGRNFLSILTKE